MTAYESLRWPAHAAPKPALCGEDQRAVILSTYGFDGLADDRELESIVQFAARLCEAPVALVSLVERNREVFLAREGLQIREAPREASFCACTMLGGELFLVPDASSDPAFAANAMVRGEPNVSFYAGLPLITPEGAPLGALCVMDRAPRPEGLSDLQREGLAVLAQAVMRRLQSRRLRLESKEEASEQARHMREIADLVPAVVWSADAQGRFDYFNSQWNAMTGREPPESVAGWRHAVHPDDADRTLAVWRKSFESGSPFESQYRLKHADGSWRWVLARALPVLDAEGSVIRWYGTLTDIDTGERLSQSRDVLARELSHRIKNIFAVVAGLIGLRARKHPGSERFAGELTAAIQALGRAHDFVHPVEGAKGESLRGLLDDLMAPYQDSDGIRVRIEGGDCEIGHRAATPLALVFHELATNAAKYGALSTDSGVVEIILDCPKGDESMQIHWRERGGPPVDNPAEAGFGTRLITMSVEGQLSGRLERRFAPGGLEIEIHLKSGLVRS